MGKGGKLCFFVCLFLGRGGGNICVFHSNKYLALGQLTQAALLHAASALSQPDLSISQPEGWMEKNSHFHFRQNQGTEKQSDWSRIICGKAESPALNPTLWVILALCAFNKNRFGPKNQTTFIANAAWNPPCYVSGGLGCLYARSGFQFWLLILISYRIQVLGSGARVAAGPEC